MRPRKIVRVFYIVNNKHGYMEILTKKRKKRSILKYITCRILDQITMKYDEYDIYLKIISIKKENGGESRAVDLHKC